MELLDEGVKVSYNDSSGATITKIVDPDDLAIALAKQSRMDTGLLPRNTRYYVKSEQYEIIVLEVPAHLRDIYFTGGNRYRVTMPPTVHILNIRNNNSTGTSKSLVSSSLFVTKVPIVDHSTQLFKFPFGNVYASGNVCWGSIKKPTYGNLAMFSAIPELLFSSTFNGDLGGNTFTPFEDEQNGITISGASGLITYLNGKPDFPYDILIPHMRFGEALRGILNAR